MKKDVKVFSKINMNIENSLRWRYDKDNKGGKQWIRKSNS